jgi:hypothetical protein
MIGWRTLHLGGAELRAMSRTAFAVAVVSLPMTSSGRCPVMRSATACKPRRFPNRFCFPLFARDGPPAGGRVGGASGRGWWVRSKT